MFSEPFLKSFRILLLPFALMYGGVVLIRNWMYNRGWLKSARFGLPLICVGNLSVGGTGKSPMVELLVRVLQGRFRVATLSRGYKRKTRGYALASAATTAIDIGDEPMQFHRKFPDLPVAVGEERMVAIPQLLHDRPDTEVIILDDAFQHRAIEAGLNILLTDFSNLYTRDFYLPTGDLRDAPSSGRRADIVVVTKCPSDLTSRQAEEIAEELRLEEGQHLFFSTIVYGMAYHLVRRDFRLLDAETEVLLVTGIANPRPLKSFLEDRVHTYYMMHYSDHHIFSLDDWKDIRKRFDAISAAKKLLLTTEKDAMRLMKYEQEISNLPFYVVPIEHRFLFGEEGRFSDLVVNFIQNFGKTPTVHGKKKSKEKH